MQMTYMRSPVSSRSSRPRGRRRGWTRQTPRRRGRRDRHQRSWTSTRQGGRWQGTRRTRSRGLRLVQATVLEAALISTPTYTLVEFWLRLEYRRGIITTTTTTTTLQLCPLPAQCRLTPSPSSAMVSILLRKPRLDVLHHHQQDARGRGARYSYWVTMMFLWMTPSDWTLAQIRIPAVEWIVPFYKPNFYNITMLIVIMPQLGFIDSCQ